MAKSQARLAVRLMGPFPVIGIALATALSVLVCFGWGGSSSSTFWRARQAEVDPPQLWSIEVVPQPAGWRAARICADSVLRSGFARPLPVSDGQPCAAFGDPVGDPGRTGYRCMLGGRMQGVSSTVTGDKARDFTATFAVTDLNGFLIGRDGAYQQVRRYRNLGPCPADWAIGDHSDRHGVHRRGAVVEGSGL